MVNTRKNNGFTLTEAIFVMVIIGLIVSLSVAILKLYNPKDVANYTLAWKMAENIESATNHILLNHSSYDDFSRIKNGNKYFSIEDKNAIEEMPKLYSKYLSDINYNVDMTNEYFSKEIKYYDKQNSGEILKESYSKFFYVADGMLIGFRFYGSCNATEKNSTPPQHHESFEINNVCGSIFYDINSYKEPNRLGLDQYILPISKREIKYNNEE